MGDFENIVAAMLRLHGREAARVARDYAARYGELGDEAESRKWLEISQAALARHGGVDDAGGS